MVNSHGLFNFSSCNKKLSFSNLIQIFIAVWTMRATITATVATLQQEFSCEHHQPLFVEIIVYVFFQNVSV